MAPMTMCFPHKHPCKPSKPDQRDPPSPPPPPPSSVTTSELISPFLIIMFCCFAVTFSSICYLTCAKRCRRTRITHHHETHEDLVNEDLGPVIHDPLWLINTVGLDQSQIESIHVFNYNRDDKLVEGTDCSVCLSEFEEDEQLRLLPKCSHAFHVPCIDTWLRSHKNCPLCRAPIVSAMNGHEIEHPTAESNSIEPRTGEQTETAVDGMETLDDHQHIVSVENNGEIVKTLDVVDETSSRVSVHSDRLQIVNG